MGIVVWTEQDNQTTFFFFQTSCALVDSILQLVPLATRPSLRSRFCYAAWGGSSGVLRPLSRESGSTQVPNDIFCVLTYSSFSTETSSLHLLGHRVTFDLGSKGSDLILGRGLSEVSLEEAYTVRVLRQPSPICRSHT